MTFSTLIALIVGLQVIVIGTPKPAVDRLIVASDLVYQGSFSLPHGTIGSSSFEYGGSALAFNPAHNSLFLVGHAQQQQVAEVTIPALGGTATLLQTFTDPTEGRMKAVGSSPATDNPQVGGLLVNSGHLLLTDFLFYDGNGTAKLSHFVSGVDLSVLGDVTGPFNVGGGYGAGFVAGWMVDVPAAWQVALGGPVLTGQCCLNIISRTSYGPAAFAFSPDSLGKVMPVPITPLIWSNGAHEPPASVNLSTRMAGAVFPTGTDSVLFFGRTGTGTYCYGEGTADHSLVGTGPADDPYCYDPAQPAKGTHLYPYQPTVWAYNAADLAKAKAGTMQPYDVQPYATWTLTLPTPTPSGLLMGVTIDPATNRIFVTQDQADGTYPRIHVFVVRPDGGGR